MKGSTGNPVNDIGWQQYTGMFLLSFATLLLELALTRVLSVANWYHFGFLVISTALLGFGSSGVTLSLWTKLREETPLDYALGFLSLLFGFVSLGSFLLMQRIPFQAFRLLVDRWQFVCMLLYYFVLAAPFFCSGLAISLLLSRGRREVNRLYAADLMGAGLGCVAVCGVMPAFGGSGSVAIAGVFGMLAALVFNSFRLSKLTAFVAVAATGMLALAFVADQALPISTIPEKVHPLKPVGRSPIYTKWNSFSRIEVYDLPVDPKKNPKVLIIGSGAGKEVLEALYFGASSITAVEINPIITDIVTKRMREHWGGLFEQPEVRLVTEEAAASSAGQKKNGSMYFTQRQS